MPKRKTAKGAKRHRAKIALQGDLELSRAGNGILIEVTDEGQRLGSIEIGHGSMIWWGRGKQLGKRIWWGGVAKLLEDASGREVRLVRRKGG